MLRLTAMRYRWVNHKQTFAHEVGRGESNDEERLSGGNGLLLTPSIDHLFDRGFISFGDEGEVLLSPVADVDSLGRMGLRCDEPLFAGRFNSDQRHFLNYHLREIFLKSAL